jgi:hypothetical protein
MRDEIKMVQAFHEKLDVSQAQRLADVPPGNDESLKNVAETLHQIAKDLEKSMQVLPNDKRYLRAHLETEELAEFVEGLAERDEVKVLDAKADQAYVLFGSALTFDLPLTSAFHEVHASNMTKEKQPEDASKDRVRKKGPNYRAADLAGVLASYRDKQGRELSPFRRQLEAEKEQRRAAAEALRAPDPDRVYGRPATPVEGSAGGRNDAGRRRRVAGIYRGTSPCPGGPRVCNAFRRLLSCVFAETRVVFRLGAVAEQPSGGQVSSTRSRCRSRHFYRSLVLAMELKSNEQVVFTVEFRDKKGNVVQAENVQWATDNSEVLALTPAADNLSCLVAAVGPLATAGITLTADGDIGDGENAIIGTAEVKVVAGDASVVTLVPGTPTEQPLMGSQ